MLENSLRLTGAFILKNISQEASFLFGAEEHRWPEILRIIIINMVTLWKPKPIVGLCRISRDYLWILSNKIMICILLSYKAPNSHQVRLGQDHYSDTLPSDRDESGGWIGWEECTIQSYVVMKCTLSWTSHG